MAYLDEHGLSVFWNKIKEYVQGQVATGGGGTVLAPENGGTGQTSLAAARGAMGLGYSTTTLAVENGGTGVTSLDGFRTNLGLGETQVPTFRNVNLTNPLPITGGGTGKTSITANAMIIGNGQSPVNEIIPASGALYATAAGATPTFGTLPISQGGTGLTSSPSMLINLASTTAANVMAASPRPGVTGILPVANGGTGASTIADARTALGIGTASDVTFRSVQVASGIQAASAVYSDGTHTYGAMRYNIDTGKYEYWDGNSWEEAPVSLPSPYADCIVYTGSKTFNNVTATGHTVLTNANLANTFHVINSGDNYKSIGVFFSNGDHDASPHDLISADYRSSSGWCAVWNSAPGTCRVNYIVAVPKSMSSI